MKQKINQYINERLAYVVMLLGDKRYDVDRDGFFKPIFKAFFLRQINLK
jgi:hypothetical protein